MKFNMFILIILISSLIQCSHDVDIKEKGFNYSIVDTVYTSRDVFGHILNHIVIIKMTDEYYSARMNRNGKIKSFIRKLKI